MNASKPIVALQEAAHAAAAAAAQNAAKPGEKTSELAITIVGVGLAAVLGVFLPGLAAVSVPIAIGAVSAGYALSRGKVKAAAIEAAATIAKTVPGPIGELAGDAAAIGKALSGDGA